MHQAYSRMLHLLATCLCVMLLAPHASAYISVQSSNLLPTNTSTPVFDDLFWDTTFGSLGVNSSVRAIASDGTNVYIGGDFVSTDQAIVHYIAKWDGSGWRALGTGLNGPVHSIVIRGTDVYVGGAFTNAGGVPANRIAKWDGISWSAFTRGIDNGVVRVLAFVGTSFYVGGTFTGPEGIASNHIIKWNENQWSALGTGVSGGSYGLGTGVWALAVDDQTLYIGGQFATADGITAKNIALWDGSSWKAFGCANGVTPFVHTITIHEADVYIGGEFESISGVDTSGACMPAGAARNLAKWNGTSWASLSDQSANGLNDHINAISIHENRVYVAGSDQILMWNGSQWLGIADLGTTSDYDTGVFSLGWRGDDLYAGGLFNSINGVAVNNIARWNGGAWATAISSSAQGVNGSIKALAASGGAVYAAGNFATAGATVVNDVAQWDGTHWRPLGSGVFADFARTAFVSGTDLYIGGTLFRPEGGTAVFVAKWDGAAWFYYPVDGLVSVPGEGGAAHALAMSNNQLYVGGAFLNHIAAWNGTTQAWDTVGGDTNGTVYALAAQGNDLYVGGDFSQAGATPANNLAHWNGSVWSPLGSALNGPVYSIAISGTDTYVGGAFTTAGGVAANNIARWDGVRWSALGMGVNGAVKQLVLQRGSLYASGTFTQAGDQVAYTIARWDGTTWSSLGSGVNGTVAALAANENGLYVGGDFTVAGAKSATSFTRWNLLPLRTSLEIQPLMSAAPGTTATLPLRYGNPGSVSLTNVVLSVVLHPGLSYRADSSGTTPIVHGAALTWHLPDLQPGEQRLVILRVQTPVAQLGNRYPSIFALDAVEQQEGLAATTSVNARTTSQVLLEQPTYTLYFPVIRR